MEQRSDPFIQSNEFALMWFNIMSEVHFKRYKLILLHMNSILEDSSFWQNVKIAADTKIRGVCLCMSAFVSPNAKG